MARLFRRPLLTFLFGFSGGGIAGYAYKKNQQSTNVLLPDVTVLQKVKDENLPFGEPDEGPGILRYSHHTLSYNTTTRQPRWVAEHLTKEHLQGEANRKNSTFQSDPNVPEAFTAENSDYKRSGYARGHMAPSGNNSFSQKAMDETFFLSNVIPQNLKNNAGFWNRVEIYCRDLTKRYSDVWITSGPLYLTETDDKTGKTFYTYQAIGKNQVAVPTHLFKIVMVNSGDADKPIALASFIIPNKELGYENQLEDYKVSLETLARQTGVHFHPMLDKSTTADLCQVDGGCKLMERESFERFHAMRCMKSAGSLTYLDRIWHEFEQQNIPATRELKDAYNAKKIELENAQNEKVPRQQA